MSTQKSTKNQKTEIVAADKAERAAKLTEKLKELVEIAKKKKNMLEYQEIADAVADVEKKFKGEGRVLIRPSGTEPLVRVMIEGKDQKVIDEEARKLAELITKIML